MVTSWIVIPSRLSFFQDEIKEAIDRLLAAWRIDVAALRCIELFPRLVAYNRNL